MSVSPRRPESRGFTLKMQAHGAFSPYAILHRHVLPEDWFFTTLIHRVAHRARRGGRWVSV
jgi:hypothetical protein